MGFFNKLARNFFKVDKKDRLKIELSSLYIEITDRLLTSEKMSRIEEKFLEPFLVEGAKYPQKV